MSCGKAQRVADAIVQGGGLRHVVQIELGTDTKGGANAALEALHPSSAVRIPVDAFKIDVADSTTDRRFNRMRPSIAPRKRHQAG